MARPRLALYPYRIGDIDRFTPRADFAQERTAVGWKWADGPPPGRTWTLYSDSRGLRGEVVGVGGLFEASPRHWHAWAIMSDLHPREWVEAGKLAAAVVDGVDVFNAPQHITATARASIPGAQTFLEKLGFAPREEVTDARLGDRVIYRLMEKVA